jgi:hypothetical protein
MWQSVHALVLIVTAAGALVSGTAAAQEPLTKRDDRGQVTVTVTLEAAPAPGRPIRAHIVLDTHVVALDGIALEQAVALRAPDGRDTAPTAVEAAKGGGHHREATVVFAAPGGEEIHLVVKNVGGVAERSFRWRP